MPVHADPTAAVGALLSDVAHDDVRLLLQDVVAENSALLAANVDLARRVQDAARLPGEITELRTEAAATRSALDEARQEAAAARAEAAALREALAEAEKSAGQQQREQEHREAMGQVLDKAATTQAEAARQVTILRGDVERLGDCVTAAEGQRDDALEALHSAQDRCESLATANDDLTAQLQRAKRSLERASGHEAASRQRAEEVELMTRKFEQERARCEMLDAAMTLETEVVRDWATLLHTVRRALEQDMVISRTCPAGAVAQAKLDSAEALTRYREHVQHAIDRSKERLANAPKSVSVVEISGGETLSARGARRLSLVGQPAPRTPAVAVFPLHALTPLGDLLLFVATLAERVNDAVSPPPEPEAPKPAPTAEKQRWWARK